MAIDWEKVVPDIRAELEEGSAVGDHSHFGSLELQISLAISAKRLADSAEKLTNAVCGDDRTRLNMLEMIYEIASAIAVKNRG